MKCEDVGCKAYDEKNVGIIYIMNKYDDIERFISFMMVVRKTHHDLVSKISLPVQGDTGNL